MTPPSLDWRSLAAQQRRNATSVDLAVEAGLLDPELAAALRPSAGLRNVLVHAYIDVNPVAVASAVRLALEQYGAYVRQVAAFLEQEARGG